MKLKPSWILGILCLVSFFVGTSLLVVTDPVESNYVLTAKEMIASGDYFSPRIYGHYWYDKPILFYWELILAFKVMGINDFAARFFPALFASAGVFMTYFFGRRLYNQKIGFVAALILGTSLEYWYLGHAIITDMTLFLTVSGTLICYYFGYTEQRARYYYAAFAIAGIAVLTKGPIGFLLPGLIILLFLIWQRDLKALLRWHMLGGFLLMLVICATWYLPMYLMHGQDFIDTFFGVHNGLRATVSEHPRDDVWYYYLLIFLAGFFPWSFVGLPAFVRNVYKRNFHLTTDPRERFLIVWALAVFVCFQSFATKYITYTFPYMMPLAILMAGYWLKHPRLTKWLGIGAAALYTILLFTLAAPLCQERSGHTAATQLIPYMQDGTDVFTYHTSYSASLVYYSGHEVKRLEKQAEIDRARPHKMAWTATNVMPFQAIEDLPADQSIIVITKNNEIESLQKEVPGNWESMGTCGEMKFYRRTAE